MYAGIYLDFRILTTATDQLIKKLQTLIIPGKIFLLESLRIYNLHNCNQGNANWRDLYQHFGHLAEICHQNSWRWQNCIQELILLLFWKISFPKQYSNHDSYKCTNVIHYLVNAKSTCVKFWKIHINDC